MFSFPQTATNQYGWFHLFPDKSKHCVLHRAANYDSRTHLSFSRKDTILYLNVHTLKRSTLFFFIQIP